MLLVGVNAEPVLYWSGLRLCFGRTVFERLHKRCVEIACKLGYVKMAHANQQCVRYIQTCDQLRLPRLHRAYTLVLSLSNVSLSFDRKALSDKVGLMVELSMLEPLILHFQPAIITNQMINIRSLVNIMKFIEQDFSGAAGADGNTLILFFRVSFAPATRFSDMPDKTLTYMKTFFKDVSSFFRTFGEPYSIFLVNFDLHSFPNLRCSNNAYPAEDNAFIIKSIENFAIKTHLVSANTNLAFEPDDMPIGLRTHNSYVETKDDFGMFALICHDDILMCPTRKCLKTTFTIDNEFLITERDGKSLKVEKGSFVVLETGDALVCKKRIDPNHSFCEH